MNERASKAKRTHRTEGRSPGYPAIDLEKAVARTREIWVKEKQHPTPIDTVVLHWKYKSLNGPASSVLASLKKFGLVSVESTKGGGKRVKITDLANQILNHPNDAIRAKAIREAALTPPIHAELWEKYGENLPSNANLKWELTNERSFTERGAREFIQEFENTIEFAKLTQASLESPLDDDFEEREEVASRESESGYPTNRRQRDARVKSDGVRVVNIPLPGGTSVVVEGDFPLNEAQWSQFLAVLNVMKLGLVSEVEPEKDIL